MSTWEVGQPLAFGLRVTDSAGVLADLGETPTATITKPDGTSTAGTVTKTGTGLYSAVLTTSLAGRYSCRWTGTGTNSAALPYTDVADVWPADPRLIIPLADARAALNLPAAIVVNDDELRLYIAAATTIIEDIVGPVLSATATETVSGNGRTGIPLNAQPAAIVSVVENGITLPAATYSVDESGILWRGVYPGAGIWSAAYPRNITITYSVGAAVVPPVVVLAAREQVRYLYQRQQAPRPTFGADAPGTSYTPSGYAVPNFVREILASQVDDSVPGFA